MIVRNADVDLFARARSTIEFIELTQDKLVRGNI